MQCTIRQRRHLECNSVRHAEPMKIDDHVGDVVTTCQVEMSLAKSLRHFGPATDAGCE